jgi:hypothetical protein
MFNELLLDDELRRVYGQCIRGHLEMVRRKIKREATGWQSMKQSLSWKITKPLRCFRRLVDTRDTGDD